MTNKPTDSGESDRNYPGRGDMLVARPSFDECCFRDAVILMLDTDPYGGKIGLVLNKLMDITLYDLLPELESGKEIEVYYGGPCEQERLFILHTLGDVFPGSFEVIPGLYVGGDFDEIVEYIESGGRIEGRMRACLGYAGWSDGQLQAEVKNGLWAVGEPPSPSELLDGNSVPYWQREVKRLGPAFRNWLLLPTSLDLN